MKQFKSLVNHVCVKNMYAQALQCVKCMCVCVHHNKTTVE